ncbi:fatty acid desaturase [Aquincola sp. MAHUQ-54]|uniref:Fatty acid desaturase n=1 Tax=Aquincola agrisoli TaxID=3119538 RepID=A0AAW9Q668_9BURK
MTDLSCTAAAVPPQVPPAPPIPHRKEIRAWLAPIAARSTAYALWLSLLDITLFALALWAAVAAAHPVLQVLAGIGAGLVIARLFILGHDACHQSFTPHRGLNRWLGRLLFLPSLTPYSLWEVGHNVVHHGYTNLKGFDFVWEPLTLAEFRALPRWRQGLERVYRSGWAPWLYYLVEVWWVRMVFPGKRHMPTRRAVFTRDGLLVSAAAALWAGGLAAAALATGQAVAWVLLVGFVLPFLVWNVMVGFVLYAHHTHTSIEWHADKASWSAAQPFVSTTVHLTFRSFVGAALHHIMEHTAHHVDMSVPLYRLRQAQRLLEARLPGRIVVQRFSLRWYFDTARRCKLYDLQARCWTDFDGRPTSPPATG